MRKIVLTPFVLLLSLFVMAQTPVAYYPFSGNANDAAGSNHGTVNGATLTTDHFGNANSAYSFDGVNDVITAPISTTVTDNFTLTGWVKLNNTAVNQILFYNGNSSLNGYGFYLTSNGVLTILHGGLNLYPTSAVLNTNQWYFLAMVKTLGNTLVFVNGNLIHYNFSSTPNTPTNQFYMSSNTIGTEFLNGAIDEVKIFNTPLTGAQVMAEYTIGQNYRSITTGNWGDATTWEVFDGVNSFPAVTVPNSNDKTITIKNGHNVTVNTPITIDEITVEAGGTLTQAADITLNDGVGDELTVAGTWTWQTGNFTGNGSAIINSGGIFNINIAFSFYRIPLINNGTINWNGDGAWIINQSSPTLTNNGAFNINGNGGMGYFNGGLTFINTSTGIVTKVSGGETQWVANTVNNGTFNINAGILRVGDGNVGFGFANNGNFNVSNANCLPVGGLFSNNTGGKITLNNGFFGPPSNGINFSNSGGTLSGNGNFNARMFNNNPNNGVISPGTSPGLLNFGWNDVFTANSILNIEVQSGSGAGTGHDQITVTGNLTLGGTLNVTETGNVPLGVYTILVAMPASGQNTISGSFANVNLPPGYTMQVNPTNIQLIRSAILPLNLISFSGSKQNNDVLLQWKTANEINVSRFEIQRSNDGQAFTTIGTVQAGGSLYSITDANTFSSRTVAFYRLKSIDVDARFTYSNIIKLSKQASAAVTVYPNPVSDVLTINGLKQKGTVLLYNADGKLLQQQIVSAQTMTMDISKYAKGIYLLQYKTEDEVVNQKIIKQ